jgi:hypothetical protein
LHEAVERTRQAALPLLAILNAAEREAVTDESDTTPTADAAA